MKKGWTFAIVTGVCWFILFGALYTGFYVWLGVERADVLKNFGKNTQGVVVAKRPDEHRTVVYYYTVDGIQYTGIGRPGFGNPEFDQLNVGDPVLVRYDEEDPFESFMGDPTPISIVQNRAAYFLAFVIATGIVGQVLAVFLIVRYVRRNRSKLYP